MPSGVIGVAVDGEHIYWSQDVAAKIGRANLDGTGVNREFIDDAGLPLLIALDGQHIYWADGMDDHIGKANLDGSGVVPDFTNAAGPYGVAVDTPKRATQTTVVCSPATLVLATSTSCTATVTGTVASPRGPSGTVRFSSTNTGSFAPADSCSLGATGSNHSSCHVTFEPEATGSVALSAAYTGDLTDAASTGTTNLGVTFQLPPPVIKPTISSLGETHSRFSVGSASTPLSGQTASKHAVPGTVFAFRLDQTATVKITIKTRTNGRRVANRCLAQTRKLRHRPRCLRTITLANLTRSAHEGLNRVRFTGRISGRPLKPGRYQARFIAVDVAGVSSPRTLHFTIVR